MVAWGYRNGRLVHRYRLAECVPLCSRLLAVFFVHTCALLVVHAYIYIFVVVCLHVYVVYMHYE